MFKVSRRLTEVESSISRPIGLLCTTPFQDTCCADEGGAAELAGLGLLQHQPPCEAVLVDVLDGAAAAAGVEEAPGLRA